MEGMVNSIILCYLPINAVNSIHVSFRVFISVLYMLQKIQCFGIVEFLQL